jgi:formate dehydrogenase major subunit/formate dehydrogenase alpha subunit
MLGSGAMTNSIQEIEDMEVIFIIGSNTKETHPVIANRMIKAHRKGARIIVADPRKVPMTRFAEVFLRIRPGTDIALLNGMANVILKEGLHDEKFVAERTEGFDKWAKTIKKFTPRKAEKITGVPMKDIIRAALMYGSSRKAGIFYTMGITQHAHGSDNVSAIANLALLTGNIGRPHTGVNPLRGQNNVQGACDVGALPNVYPGYQKVDIPNVKKKFEKAWGRSLSATDGLKSTEMIPMASEGKIKVLYIMGENPVLSDPNMAHTIKALKNLSFLVVQDIFLTETAALADVVLPAACFAEKNGTFTNTERKVQLVRKAVNPPGNARDDMRIISEISYKMGYPMGYNSEEDVFQEIGKLWPALAGITYDRLKRSGIQWPCPTVDHPGTRYLYKAGFPRGKALFTSVECVPAAEPVDDEYPFVLISGRNLFQYHTGSMTRRVAPIEEHAGVPYIEINEKDALSLGIEDGDTVKISSRRGTINIKVRISERVMEGTVFIPMHYREAAVNVLTIETADPKARIPELKACAVKIKK